MKQILIRNDGVGEGAHAVCLNLAFGKGLALLQLIIHHGLIMSRRIVQLLLLLHVIVKLHLAISPLIFRLINYVSDIVSEFRTLVIIRVAVPIQRGGGMRVILVEVTGVGSS